jgi:hypothetical protein
VVIQGLTIKQTRPKNASVKDREKARYGPLKVPQTQA